MKVLFLINSLGAGGAERSIAEMLPHLIRADIQPIVACFHRNREGVEQAVLDQGCAVHFLTGLRLAERVRQVNRILREEKPALLHTTLFDADIIGRLAAIGHRMPVLCSLVNTSYDPVRLQDERVVAWKLWGVQMIDAWTARYLTTHFHAITETVKQSAVRDLGISPGRITVIERGRDPKRLGSPSAARRQAARQMLGIRPEDELIVNVGRQEFQKGQGHLLDAMALLLRRRPRAILMIAGRPGNASSNLEEALRRLDLEQRVQLLGHRDDVPDILAAADLFVFPSLYEGLGGALIEAMALGLPIVASDLPVLREVVEAGANASLVKPAAPAELAAAMDLLLDDPDRARRYGVRSREVFVERYRLEVSTSRMLALYQALVRGQAPGNAIAAHGMSKWIKGWRATTDAPLHQR